MTQPNQWTPPPPQFVPVAPNGQRLASFGDRFVAFLIDTAIFLGVYLIVMVPMIVCWVFYMTNWADDISSPRGEPDAGDVLAMFIPMLLMFALLLVLSLGFTYLYYVEWQLRKGGQTIGKSAMKLRVIPVDPATQLDRGMLAKRWAVQSVVGAFVPLFSYLDGFWQLWDKPLQQCLHDKAASTVVVKVG